MKVFVFGEVSFLLNPPLASASFAQSGAQMARPERSGERQYKKTRIGEYTSLSRSKRAAFLAVLSPTIPLFSNRPIISRGSKSVKKDE